MSEPVFYAQKNDGAWAEAIRAWTEAIRADVTITEEAQTPEQLIESITTRKVLIDAIGEDIKRQRKRKEEHEWALEQEKAELVRLLKNKGLSKMETDRGSARVSRSKALQVRDLDKLEKEYPEYFETVESVKFKKQEMKDDMLKNGVTSDYAYIEERESVVVK